MNRIDKAILYYLLATFNVWLVTAGSKTGVKAKGQSEEDNYGVKYASKCEVCRVVSKELEHQLTSNFNSPEMIATGYNALQDKNKKIPYERSLIRLQEAVESTCRSIMREYSIHKERKDWTRFARGQSQTFSTLHGLRNKGVKVDLGMPEEMWDKPSAEITQLKSQCDSFLEDNEMKIERWYQKGSSEPLDKFICKKALRKADQDCLVDPPAPPPKPKEKPKPKKKSEADPSKSKEKTETDPLKSKEKTETDPLKSKEKTETDSAKPNEKSETDSIKPNEKSETKPNEKTEADPTTSKPNEKMEEDPVKPNEKAEVDSTKSNEKTVADPKNSIEKTEADSSKPNEKCEADLSNPNEKCQADTSKPKEKTEL